MRIFYADITRYLKNKPSRAQIKAIQHKYGELLTEKIAKEFYGIKDCTIKIINKKPYFANSDINFSVSHSENIVIVAFDSNPVGVDAEKIKPRNFKALAKRYGLKDESPETFYEFWTKYEAGIKLQQKAQSTITTEFLNGFILTVTGDFGSDYTIEEVAI